MATVTSWDRNSSAKLGPELISSWDRNSSAKLGPEVTPLTSCYICRHLSSFSKRIISRDRNSSASSACSAPKSSGARSITCGVLSSPRFSCFTVPINSAKRSTLIRPFACRKKCLPALLQSSLAAKSLTNFEGGDISTEGDTSLLGELVLRLNVE